MANKFGLGGVKEWFLGELDPERNKPEEIKDHDVTDKLSPFSHDYEPDDTVQTLGPNGIPLVDGEPVDTGTHETSSA